MDNVRVTFRPAPILALLAASLPIAIATQLPQAEATGPTADQVFKDIQAFKGVPAKDLIPSMEFMSASLKMECKDCHDMKDFSIETRGKATARRMIAMQRGINEKYFQGRNQVTCMSCHNGKEHPSSTPVPDGTSLRHKRATITEKPEELLAKHEKAVGTVPAAIEFVGTQAPIIGTEGAKAEEISVTQAADGRFVAKAKSTSFGFDGTQVWRDDAALMDEPAAIFGRIGRSWRGPKAFEGLDRLTIGGTEKLGKVDTTVVRGTRTATGATEELYFDNKSGLLVRFVNVTHSSLGNVISVYDYNKYRTVSGVKVPMDVDITFAGGEKWPIHFKSAKALDKVDSGLFTLPKAG